MRSATKFRTFSQRAQTTERSEHLLRFHLVREARGEALPVDLLALNFVVLAREFVRLQPVHFKKNSIPPRTCADRFKGVTTIRFKPERQYTFFFAHQLKRS